MSNHMAILATTITRKPTYIKIFQNPSQAEPQLLSHFHDTPLKQQVN